MNPLVTYVGGLLLTCVGIVPGVLAYRATQQADKRAKADAAAAKAEKVKAAEDAEKIENRKADRDELESAITEWRTLFEGVKLELAVEREARRNEASRADKAETTAREARVEVADLKDRVAHLEADLRHARDEIARLTAA